MAEVWKDAMQQGRIPKTPQQVDRILSKWRDRRTQHEAMLQEHRGMRHEDRMARRCERQQWSPKVQQQSQAAQRQLRKLERFQKFYAKLELWVTMDAEKSQKHVQRKL